MTNKNNEQDKKSENNKILTQHQPSFIVVFYVVLMSIASCWALYTLFAITPDQIQKTQPPISLKVAFLNTAGMMLCSGVLGGCLYDIRGLMKHSAQNDFNSQHNISYMLRPFAGALSGLIIFFLLLGGVMVFGMSSQGSNFGSMAWTSFQGRMPYITFAMLAGYASHSFMLKLKDISDSVFATREYHKKERHRMVKHITSHMDAIEKNGKEEKPKSNDI